MPTVAPACVRGAAAGLPNQGLGRAPGIFRAVSELKAATIFGLYAYALGVSWHLLGGRARDAK
jgi:hypothetical protein